jgi:small GTP-binding protein
LETAELHTHGSPAVADSLFAAFRHQGVAVIEDRRDASGVDSVAPCLTRAEMATLLEPSWFEPSTSPCFSDHWWAEFVRPLVAAKLPPLQTSAAAGSAVVGSGETPDLLESASSVELSLRRLQSLAYQHLGRAQATEVGRRLWAQLRGALLLRLRNIALQFSAQPRAACADLDQLLSTWAHGQFLSREIQVLVTGVPNVGKSSLINALLGYERSVVSERPGTTRDLVGQTTSMAGWPFRLIDSAGLRTSDDELEEEGIRRVALAARQVDLIVVVTSVDQPAATISLPSTDTPVISVLNKVDLQPANDQAAGGLSPDMLAVSTKTGQGLKELMAQMVQKTLSLEVDAELGAGLRPTAIVFAEDVWRWLQEWRQLHQKK